MIRIAIFHLKSMSTYYLPFTIIYFLTMHPHYMHVLFKWHVLFMLQVYMVQLKVLRQTGMLSQQVCPHSNVLQLKNLNSN